MIVIDPVMNVLYIILTFIITNYLLIIVVKSLKLETQVKSSFVLFSYISQAVSIMPGNILV